MESGDQLALQTIIAQQGSIASDVSAMRTDVAKALTHLELVEQRNQAADRVHADHEARLRLLERFRWTLGGAVVVGGALAGLIGDLIGRAAH